MYLHNSFPLYVIIHCTSNSMKISALMFTWVVMRIEYLRKFLYVWQAKATFIRN